MMEQQLQEPVYTFDENDWPVGVYNRTKPEDAPVIPKNCEGYCIEKSTTIFFQQCNSCPTKSHEAYILIVGNVKLLRMCPKCLARFKRCVMKFNL